MDTSTLIQSASTASLRRVAPSPVDIAMDSSRLRQDLGISGTPFVDVARQVWEQLAAHVSEPVI